MPRHHWLAAASAAACLAVPVSAASAYSPVPTRVAWMNHTGGDYEIQTMNADGSGVTRLTNNTVSDMDPAFSPDGRQIAWAKQVDANRAELFLMNADGSQPLQLTNTAKESVRGPSWSPDGRTIYYMTTVSYDGGATANPDDDIYSITRGADGVWGAPTVVRSTAGNESEPQVSPDGTKLAFAYDADGTGPGLRAIWISNLDGSGAHRVTTGTAEELTPSWSPDGTQLAFSRTYIYTVSVATGRETKVTNVTGYYPKWSSTSANDIVFDSYGKYGWDTTKLNLATRRTTVIGGSRDNDINADW